VEYFAPAELTVAVDIDAGAYADYLYNATTLQALCSAALQADNSSNRLGGTCVSIHVYVCVCIHVYVCMYVKYVCKYMYVCMCVCGGGGGILVWVWLWAWVCIFRTITCPFDSDMLT
jgi:hypothetical protein